MGFKNVYTKYKIQNVKIYNILIGISKKYKI